MASERIKITIRKDFAKDCRRLVDKRIVDKMWLKRSTLFNKNGNLIISTKNWLGRWFEVGNRVGKSTLMIKTRP